MTSSELYEKLRPKRSWYEIATYWSGKRGLDCNMSSIYTELIKDAARCNNYSSDVIYDIREIDRKLESFEKDAPFDPVWIGFRKMGVDGTNYVLSRVSDSNDPVTYTLSANYFALYSMNIELTEYGNYHIVMNEYAV